MESNNHSPSFLTSSKVPRILLGTFAFICIASSMTQWKSARQDQGIFIAPPPLIERFTFGYSEVSADVLWIRSLQDFGYCEKLIEKNVCQNKSWLYKMLDAITDLSPKFRIAYAAGGLSLTIIANDFQGATAIFEKGVKAFPNDWPILYRAAYHYIYEEKDKKRAAEMLIQAGQNGAPPWVFSLAGRLYTEAGQRELAEALLKEMIDTNQDPVIIERLRKKLGYAVPF